MRKYLCLFYVALVLALSATTAMGACLKDYSSYHELGEYRFLPFEPMEGPYPLSFYFFSPASEFCRCSELRGEFEGLAVDTMIFLGELRIEKDGHLIYIEPDDPLGARLEGSFLGLAQRLQGLTTAQDKWDALNMELSRFVGGDFVGLTVLMLQPGESPPFGYLPRFKGAKAKTCEQVNNQSWSRFASSMDALENPLPGMRLFTHTLYEYASKQQREEREALHRQRMEQRVRQAGEQSR